MQAMEPDSPPGPLEWAIGALRRAINTLRPDKPKLAESFTEEDLQKLLAEGYQTTDDLAHGIRSTLTPYPSKLLKSRPSLPPNCH